MEPNKVKTRTYTIIENSNLKQRKPCNPINLVHTSVRALIKALLPK